MDETAQEYIERIRNGAQRMGLLVESLLKLSKIKHSELKKTELNLSVLMEDVVKRLKEKQPNHFVEVSIQPSLMVYGDANMLSAVAENLLNNAWKYSAKKEHPCIEFSSFEDEGETVYFVKDNGAGFDMQFAKDKLFGTFQRLHNDKDFEGTGIGLATVKRIINLHQGRIWAQAEEGEGACFYFTLPE